MGAAKPMKPSKAGKRGKANGGGAGDSLLGGGVLVSAIVVVVAAYVIYSFVGPPSTPDVSAGQAQREGTRSAGRGQRKPARELTPHELRQQGRTVPGANRPRCQDAGAGCAAATAEQCSTDPKFAARCCASCFKQTCIDRDPTCIARAQHGACYLEPGLNETCCFACSPDPLDRCSPDPQKRPEVSQ